MVVFTTMEQTMVEQASSSTADAGMAHSPLLRSGPRAFRFSTTEFTQELLCSVAHGSVSSAVRKLDKHLQDRPARPHDGIFQKRQPHAGAAGFLKPLGEAE